MKHTKSSALLPLGSIPFRMSEANDAESGVMTRAVRMTAGDCRFLLAVLSPLCRTLLLRVLRRTFLFLFFF